MRLRGRFSQRTPEHHQQKGRSRAKAPMPSRSGHASDGLPWGSHGTPRSGIGPRFVLPVLEA
ncbi:hypothetical protein FA95DRAFT_279277 [Auriscalpium vulgare]|uniref:Uncharacterized protein n=1 Tax=Auriscalpium vulgare TaxID=40419 RepID=A0ACB8S4S3_9AGAM|nr:hypothetical protein FA95DRAFT_279277 [Auriscalpium vulgare]